MTPNLFDYLEDSPARDGGHSPWAARAPRRPQRDYDLKLLPRASDWPADADSLRALKLIEGEPWVEGVTRERKAVRGRVADGWIAMAGAALAARGTAQAPPPDL